MSATKIISTNTFKIKVDTVFTEEQKSYETFSIWNNKEQYTFQFPIINMALGLQSDLDEDFKGDSYIEKVYDYYIIKRLNQTILNKETVTIAGKKAYLQRSFSLVKRDDKTAEVFHLFINIPLESGYMQEFSADCEIEVRNTYEPLFMQAIESIEWFDDLKTFIDIQEDAHNTQMARIDAILAKTDIKEGDYEKMIKEQQEVKESTETNFNNIVPFEVPQDSKNLFQIGDWDFTFDEKESYINVTEFSSEFVVNLVANTKNFSTAIQANLLDTYPGEGLVKLTFGVKNVYDNGVPRADLLFEEDKCKNPHISLRKDGFEYSLDFFGRVTLQEGWVAYNGYLKPPYRDSPVFPVTIYKQIDIKNIDWKFYHFSFEEALQVDPKIVKKLTVNVTDRSEIPTELFSFINLKNLTISARKGFYPNNSKANISKIPEAIGTLTELESLFIQDTKIEYLPESIGKLIHLKNLNVSNNQLKRLPYSLLQLRQLELCWLSDNQLVEIPANINTPKLRNIDLKDNQLRTLPAALAHQPQLQNIQLEKNPLEHLPDDFNNVKGIGLAIEDKLRLLNFDYQGADGKGVITWDDTIFYAEHDAQLVSQINSVLVNDTVKTYADTLRSLVKKAVGFRHTQEEDYAQLGNHRFGGMPDLPKSITYPRFGANWRNDKTDYIYEFIAQINCVEIAHLQDYLPRKGMLYFFLETIHSVYDGGNQPPVKVLFYEGDEPLISGKQLQFTEDDYSEMSGDCYKGFKVAAAVKNSAPYFYSIDSNAYILKNNILAEDDHFLDNVVDEQFGEPINEQVPSDYEMNAYTFTQNDAPELQASLQQKGKPEDWTTLLTVKSRGDFCWGDAGDLYFVIHKSDLAKQDFRNVFCTLESS